MLRMNLEFANADGRIRTVMVTSAMAGEGKTTTAANLAVTLARAGRSVVLVDADFLQPSQAGLFSIAPTPGLVQVVSGEVSLARALTTIRIPNPGWQETGTALSPMGATVTSPFVPRRTTANRSSRPHESNGSLRVLPTSTAPPNATEELLGDEFRTLVRQLENDAELVIVDAPPLGTSVTLWLGSLIDATLVVANPNVLRESTLDELVHSLDQLPGEKVGFVLTGVDWFPRRNYGYRTAVEEPETMRPTSIRASSDRGW